MKPAASFLTGLLLFGAAMHEIQANSPVGEKSKLMREAGALYLEDLGEPNHKIRIPQATRVFSSMAMDRSVGTLVANRDLEIIALSVHSAKVRGKAAHGDDVVGWIPRDVLGIPKEVDEKLAKIAERQKLVEELIANKQVALGMNSREVRKSLGRPDQTSTRVDKEGTSEIYDYIVYEHVPQRTTSRDRFGRLFETTIMVKVETGRMTVTLLDDVVTSIEESKGNPLGRGGVKIVPGPIEIF